MEVIGQPIGGGVHVHRRHDHTVLQRQPAQAKGLEHGRRLGGGGRRDASPHLVLGEPSVGGRDELRVSQAQVVVRDTPAAREDVEGELRRLLMNVLPEILEPLQACLRRPLRRQHDRPALGVVRSERLGGVTVLVQARGERKRILHGQLGARTDGEVRGVRGVAEEHDVAVPPARAPHGREVDPA